MKVEGEIGKPFGIYWLDINDHPHECEAEYETIEQVRSHRYRLDRQYKIRVRGRKYLTRTQFEEWAKKQK